MNLDSEKIYSKPRTENRSTYLVGVVVGTCDSHSHMFFVESVKVHKIQ